MAQQFTCSQGHRWQAGTGSAFQCPVCGGRAQLPAPVNVMAAPRQAPAPVAPDIPGNSTTLPFDSFAASRRPGTAERTLPPGASGVETDGRNVPGYEIMSELGRGGMGVVYKARHVRLKRVRALPLHLAGAHASPQELARFKAEAEAVAPLQHPNIVQIYEVGEHQGHPYFSLEFVEGGSLAQQLDGSPQPSRWAAQLVETLARAIHFAHGRSIIHRDLKPANILLSGLADLAAASRRSQAWASSVSLASGSTGPVPKITDFGLAKQLAKETNQTRTGAVLGTPSYIAPEQAAGRKDVGPAVDVYALGAILYELLTGRPPFRGETPMDTMLQVMSDEPVPPSRLQPKVPRDLETICLKCLEKDAKKRYPDAEALADDLRRFLNSEPIEARPIGMVARGFKWARRRPAWAALVILCALGAFSVWIASLVVSATLHAANQRVEAHAARAEAGEQSALQAKAKEEEQRRRAEEQTRRTEASLEDARRSNYAFQLGQVAGLSRRDPGQGLILLDDPNRCPEKLRDFTWNYLHRLCQRERAALSGPKEPVAALAAAPNGQVLAAASGDTVIVWDGDNPKPRVLKKTHFGPVLAIAFSPDSATLATASFDKNIKLWDVSNGQERGTLEGHTDAVRAVAFSPDGKTLASASHDRSVRLWDVTSRKSRATLTGHTGPVTSVSFAADGRTLASGAGDQTVRLWDPILDRQLESLGKQAGLVRAVQFAPHGNTIAVGLEDGTIQLWDAMNRTKQATLRGHLDAVTALAFADNGKVLASTSEDQTTRLWQPVTGEERLLLRGHTKAVRGLAFSPDGKTLATGGADHLVKLWNVAPPADGSSFKVLLDAGQSPILGLQRDGRNLVVVSNTDRAIHIWNTLTGDDRPFKNEFTSPVTCVALSLDGKTLAAGAEDRAIKVYDETGRAKPQLTGHTGRIDFLTFAPDNRTLLSGSADGTARLWDVPSGQVISVIGVGKGAVPSGAFTGDGRLLAAGGADGTVKLWNVGSRTDAGSLPRQGGPVRWLAFSPDGKTLALPGKDGQLAQLWNMPNNKLAAPLVGQAGAVRCAAFSPDGKTLATGHADRTVILWDAVGGQQRSILTGHDRPIETLAFTGDGQMLISVSDDGEVRRWLAAPRK